MKTTRKINSLENIVLPRSRSIARYIEDLLEEDELEEFVKAKKIGGALTRRRD
jgi:vacuolar-type H+-ATPase subunit D/Vma8